MQEFKIEGVKRESLGKKESVAIRNSGRIPCVIYGGKDQLHFHGEELVLEKLISTPKVYVVDINIAGKSEKAILQDVQFHPVSDKIIHMDFLKVSDSNPITVKLPVKLEGNPEGVLQGGKLQVKMRKIKVKGLINNLPDELVIDISSVGLGQSVKIETLSFNSIEILESKNAVVCAVKLTRSAVKAPEGGK